MFYGVILRLGRIDKRYSEMITTLLALRKPRFPPIGPLFLTMPIVSVGHHIYTQDNLTWRAGREYVLLVAAKKLRPLEAFTDSSGIGVAYDEVGHTFSSKESLESRITRTRM